MNKDFTLTASDGEKIFITAYFNDKYVANNAVIYVHGFKGFKDWGFIPYLANYLVEKGFFVITFNFSHNGIGENRFEFRELEKFAKNTFSREVRELNEIVDAVDSDIFEFGKFNKIGLLGHSRGGAISILTAFQNNKVNAVAVWASISKLDRYSKRQKEEWEKKEFFEVLNTRTNQIMKLHISILRDIEDNYQESLNIEKAIKNLKRPLLIVHGDQDLAVPIEEAEQIYSWSDKSQTEFFKIFGTGHTFDAAHPFFCSNRKLESVLEKTEIFFKHNLN
ncbi:MAG: alpha/beta hydrolase [Ignavibacteria bacterium]|nr:alpha/beta hydrolase [Ignavibacteria bacterium]